MFFGSDSVFLFMKFTREVKLTAIFYRRIKHDSFSSFFIRENVASVSNRLRCVLLIFITVFIIHNITLIYNVV